LSGCDGVGMTISRTTVTWRIAAGMRSAIDAEASRRGVAPSRIVEELIARYLPVLVERALREAFEQAGRDRTGDGAR